MVVWNAETSRDMLKRIAALLFALADLADRASLAPLSVRTHALGILLPAEAIAYALVIATARGLGVAMPPQAGPDDNDPGDTMRLALSLRVLALVLANLSAWADFLARYGSGHIATTTEMQRKPGRLAHCQDALPPPDTS